MIVFWLFPQTDRSNSLVQIFKGQNFALFSFESETDINFTISYVVKFTMFTFYFVTIESPISNEPQINLVASYTVADIELVVQEVYLANKEPSQTKKSRKHS
ncbi:hypothetical protein MKX03_003111 [Papaver bracteatum]|nr:hypothetical protein MKX03_003111 [Papaver bracteatum]